jgi:hypothetical protein
MDKIVEDCRQRIAGDGGNLTCVGVASDMEFKL